MNESNSRKRVVGMLFSCGTEHEYWMSHNCDLCVKAGRYNKNGDWVKSICGIYDDIEAQFIRGDEHKPMEKSLDAVCHHYCPYRQTEYSKRARKPKKQPKEQLNLF